MYPQEVHVQDGGGREDGYHVQQDRYRDANGAVLLKPIKVIVQLGCVCYGHVRTKGLVPEIGNMGLRM